MARRLALVVALAGAGCGSPPATDVPRPPRAIGTRSAPPSTTTSTTAVPTTTSTTATTALLPPPPAPGGEAPRPGPSPGAGSTIDVLACIRRYESGGDYSAVSAAGHAGAYQFERATWRGAVTRAGHPEWADRPANEAPAAVQDAAAAQLLAERGLQPWPTPSRRCA